MLHVCSPTWPQHGSHAPRHLPHQVPSLDKSASLTKLILTPPALQIVMIKFGQPPPYMHAMISRRSALPEHAIEAGLP